MKFDLELLKFIECDVEVEKLALSGSDKDLTWAEFKEAVQKQIDKILEFGLPQGHPVVIYGHKEVKFVVSIVACMSLKMPYIPVDTIYPRKRLGKIIEITNSALLIDLEKNQIQFNKNNKYISYDRDDQIIYIMFTSGSTGEPKGVQITKSAILDFKEWLANDFKFNDKNIFMNQPFFSFDVSVYALMGFLLFGGTNILNSRNMIEDHIEYFERLRKYKCNIWVSTPSFISKLLLSDKFNANELNDLDTFLFCGETLPSMTVKRIFRNFPDSNVVNTYGPTEATVATTIIDITQNILDKYPKNLPIGYVKPHTIINLADKNEDGIGEIEIIGENVSIGYFQNKILNKEKFSLKGGVRAFRTGDYGYFEGDMLFFTNRKDDLVKLHGFRIETTEIDMEMINTENIQDAITLPLKRGNEVLRLITFFISQKNIDTESIKNSISKKLPYYMIPSDIVQIDKFPYNANHKIDKKELINIYKNL